PERLNVNQPAIGGDTKPEIADTGAGPRDRFPPEEADLAPGGRLGEGPPRGTIHLPRLTLWIGGQQPDARAQEWSLHSVVAEEVTATLEMKSECWPRVLRPGRGGRGEPQIGEVVHRVAPRVFPHLRSPAHESLRRCLEVPGQLLARPLW